MYMWVEQTVIYVSLQKYLGLRITLWTCSFSPGPEWWSKPETSSLVFFKNTIYIFFSPLFIYSI
jgi:hypothetical protein